MKKHINSDYANGKNLPLVMVKLGKYSFSQEVDYWCQLFPDKSRGEVIKSRLDRNYSEDDAQLISGFSHRYGTLTGLPHRKSYEQSFSIIKYLERELDKKSLKKSLRNLPYKGKIIEILTKGNEDLFINLEKILTELEKEELNRVTA